MCGIAGYVSRQDIDLELLERMGDCIRHRGPDDYGTWRDERRGIGFAHRRLSIVDLSPQGHQPMTSSNGLWTICFNGEVYNHAAIRRELEALGHMPLSGWRGHSDTETLLEAIAVWGVERTIERCVGMFAIALFDKANRRLTLIRDRFGEKPLYYGWCGRDLVFSSELKALRAHPQFDGELERRSLPGYFATGTIGGSWSIHRRIFKLLPGCRLDVDCAEGPPPSRDEPPTPGIAVGPIRLFRYWDYRQVVAQGSRDPIVNEAEAVEALDESLRNAIRDQAVADVPVGAFLSGGIDSSSIVALYQAVSNQQVRTYTIAFDDPDYDESKHARRVAEHLGTSHREFSVTVAEAREVIPLLSTIYDEPFADSSQIPTYLVSKLARQEVTVGLTGDGGDELFGGYHRHVMAPRFWQRLGAIPGPVRTAVFGPVSLMPGWALSGAGAAVGLSPKARSTEVVRKFARVAAQASGFDDVADSFVDEWYGMKPPVAQTAMANCEDRALPLSADLLTQITYRDAINYLPDDILVKVDRASMAVSLETRVPFLDHRVVALAARIPSHLKVERGSGKAILRTLLARHLPRDHFERPKAGFGIPVGDWIKGPLREWAEALLDEQRLRDDGLLDVAVVRKRWAEHLNGRRNSTSAIWAVLMFQGWREAMGGRGTAARMLNA